MWKGKDLGQQQVEHEMTEYQRGTFFLISKYFPNTFQPVCWGQNVTHISDLFIIWTECIVFTDRNLTK